MTVSVPSILRDPEQRALAANGQKRCRACRNVKPLAAFGRSRRSGDGYAYRCRECDRTRARARQAERQIENAGRDPYADPTPKRCSGCGDLKPREQFSRAAHQPDGLQHRCKPCQMSEWRMSTYGRDLHPDDRCEGCGRADELCIDHDHGTGKVRGILCQNCNRAVGLAADDPARLEALAGYLKRAASP